MPDALMPVVYEPPVVLLSFLIALAASYVALSLARRVHSPDAVAAVGWCLGGSVAMGTGIWAMHFVAMLAIQLPVRLGYAAVPTALSWLAAVAVSALALYLVAGARLSPQRLAGGALAMGAGICAMHYIGMAALHFEPGIRWHADLIAASAAIAVFASAVALALFQQLQRLSTRVARRWQVAAALVLAVGISGMHYTGMAAADFPLGAVCISASGLCGDRLAVMVTIAAMLLLAMTFGLALLDERQSARTADLSQTLLQVNQELEQATLHDPLTGLLNRRGLDQRLQQVRALRDREGGRAALLLIDLDGFRVINELHGLAYGDTVLHAVAQRLKGVLHEGDTLAALGADEFALLRPWVPDADAACAAGGRVLDALRRPLPIGAHDLRLTAAIGVAPYPDAGPADQWLDAASVAVQAAKAAGGARVVAYEPQLRRASIEQLGLVEQLRRAIERREPSELMLHYQPKVNCAGGGVAGVEALLRWRHPERGMVGPAVFIPLAERFGLIDALGRWVIDEACRQLDAWRRDGLVLQVAVNLSMHQLREDGLVAHVQAALRRHALPASLLMFEITESAALTDAETVLPVFDELAALGITLSIDDFGTGYSSLAYLRRLPSCQVKIDRSFVQDLDSCDDARAIVQAVVGLGHALSLAVVAEGVETVGQLELLARLGCDQLQGYLFARPVAGDTVLDWFRGIDRPSRLQFGAARPALARAAA